MVTPRYPSARRPRRGFTLAELLVVVVLLGLVGSAITTVVVRQQRFYRGANEILDTRGQIRQAAMVLPTELRNISTAGGDILDFNDQQIDFRTTYGSSVYCEQNSATPRSYVLPPITLTSGQVLTSFITEPRAGDTVFVFDDGTDPNITTDDTWRKTVIMDPITTVVMASPPTGSVLNCQPISGFTQIGDLTQVRPRYKLWDIATGSYSAAPNVPTGAPMRFTRPVRYKLYQASDGKWYLGYSQYTGGAWSAIEPVSGPYLAGTAANEADRGLRFRLYNQAGAEVTTLAAATTVTRIDIVVRGETNQAVQLSGTAPTRPLRDSLNLSVAIRNWQ